MLSCFDAGISDGTGKSSVPTAVTCQRYLSTTLGDTTSRT